ncbi:MAG: hypothetical protein Q7W29_03640 [bacterium]|nr:hypothetical protein [bacterium]
MIKIVEPDHRPETQAPIADETCNCACVCGCATVDTAVNSPARSAKSDTADLPIIHGRRGRD